jgi:two-component sensor histidine kinase
MIATLFARWRAGLITLLLTFFYSWYALLPNENSFVLANPADGPRLIVVAVTTLLTLALADLFRAAVRRAALERQHELENRDLLLREIDHRMKNNFAIVASLLELQKRQEKSEEARNALAAASARVQSFSSAHRSLYSDGADIHSVDMRDYLKTLIEYLAEALFLTGRVNVRFKAESMAMPRDQAVSVGLVLNEVVTNAAKHAFVDNETGEIVIDFSNTPQGWRLEVSDNGRGISEAPAPGGGGLGSRLITAFAQKAGAEVIVERPIVGARIIVRSLENGAA